MSKELFDAIHSHDIDRLSRLLTAGEYPNATSPDWPHWSALRAAVGELEEGGPLEAVVLLLRSGADVEGGNEDTPLLLAFYEDQPAAVDVLLAAGANTNVRGGEGDSPLRWCAEHGDVATAAKLLRCGATATIDEAAGPSGASALGRAAMRLDLPMIKLLLQWGADPRAYDIDRMTARDRLPPATSENETMRLEAERLLASRAAGNE